MNDKKQSLHDDAANEILKSMVITRLDLVKVILIAIALGAILTIVSGTIGVVMAIVGGLILFSEIYGRVMTGRT